jgi:hypothetical protein
MNWAVLMQFDGSTFFRRRKHPTGPWDPAKDFGFCSRQWITSSAHSACCGDPQGEHFFYPTTRFIFGGRRGARNLVEAALFPKETGSMKAADPTRYHDD